MFSAILGFFDWKIWFSILILIIFVLWVFWGGKDYHMVGLKPLDPRNDLKDVLGSEDYQRRRDDLTPYDIETINPDQNIDTNQNVNQNVNINTNQNIDVNTNVNQNTEISSVGSVDVGRIVKRLRNRNIHTGDKDVNISFDTTPAIPREVLSIVPPRINTRPGRKFNRHSKKEELCRKILEEIYTKPFPSIRPGWLRNPETGYPLEIDCYNEELKLGLECNGEQHYVWPNFTGQPLDQFKAQVRRDIFKVDRCDQNGVYLITVPYSVPDHMTKEYIKYYLPETVIQRLAK